MVPAGARLYFNTDGTAFTGFFQSPPSGAFRFKEEDGVSVFYWRDGGFGADDPWATPAAAPAIERDPSVNKSLLLRLIAGVRGL